MLYDGLILWMMHVQGRWMASTRRGGAALALRLKTAPRRRYSPFGTGGAPAEKLMPQVLSDVGGRAATCRCRRWCNYLGHLRLLAG